MQSELQLRRSRHYLNFIILAPIERETHMRAVIVEREDMPALVDEKDGAMAAVHNESAFGF